MSRRLRLAAIVLVFVFAAAQLVRPSHTNPPMDASRTVQAQMGTANGLVAVLDRACGDCHSDRTVWPWYSQIAPLSWLMTLGVAEGRKAVNFSEWSAYPPDRQRQLLAQACRDVSEGRMPGKPWTMLHPEARLSAHDIETICRAAQPAEAQPVSR